MTTTTILSNEDLKTLVPAAFADHAAKRTSDRYSFMPTHKLVEDLTNRGWFPVRAHQSSRVQDPLTAKHMIAFRKPNVNIVVGDTLPEVLLLNSHDATKRFILRAGFFRLVCSNGLIVGTGIGETKTDRIHIDGNNADVGEALRCAMDKLEEATTQIELWKQTNLDAGARLDFANDAIVIRNGGDKIWSRHFSATDFLQRRRAADTGNDVWTVFNVLQENVLKGGVQGPRRLTKAINQVAEQTRINTQLWQLAEHYGNLHSRS